LHTTQLAASRTFCTAGTVRPIRMPMIAMTTSISMSVNPRRDLMLRLEVTGTKVGEELSSLQERDDCSAGAKRFRAAEGFLPDYRPRGGAKQTPFAPRA